MLLAYDFSLIDMRASGLIERDYQARAAVRYDRCRQSLCRGGGPGLSSRSIGPKIGLDFGKARCVDSKGRASVRPKGSTAL